MHLSLQLMFRRWKDISVGGKLSILVGLMAFLIATELLTLRFAMESLSSVRAFVGGNGLWSKAEKDSIIALQNYAQSRREKDFAEFQNQMQISLGDRQARIEMLKPNPDSQVIQDGLGKGRIHPDDVPGLVRFVQRFYWEPHVAKALAIWKDADDHIQVLMREATTLQTLVQTRAPKDRIDAQMARIREIDAKLNVIEDDFAAALGEGSRYLEKTLLFALLALVLTAQAWGSRSRESWPKRSEELSLSSPARAKAQTS